MTKEVPQVTAQEIIDLQDRFDLSDNDLAAALGYPGQPEIVRRWKSGTKSGKPFVMVPSARAAFIYLRGLLKAYVPGEGGVRDIMRSALPEFLQ